MVSSAEMERMMKVQEVILKAMAGSLKWWEAAEIIGVTDRTMRRWRERYQEGGYDGLYDRRKRRPSPKRVAMKTAEHGGIGRPGVDRHKHVCRHEVARLAFEDQLFDFVIAAVERTRNARVQRGLLREAAD